MWSDHHVSRGLCPVPGTVLRVGTYFLLSPTECPCGRGAFSIPISQMRKRKYRNVKQLAQGSQVAAAGFELSSLWSAV